MTARVFLNVGEVYGKWTVIAAAERKTHYLCRCGCGTEREVHKNSLRHGYSVSCGCHVPELKRSRTADKLVGQRFGRLTVLSFSSSRKRGNEEPELLWTCKCDCGNECEASTHILNSGHKNSCGCLQKEMRASYGWTAKIDDKAGKRFGRLTAIEISHKAETGQIYWRCRCDCGTESHMVRAGALNSGEVKSCGCLWVDTAKANFTKHGLSHLPEYPIWKSLKARCRNTNLPNYKDYGGRGITVCDSWANSFEEFYKDMGSRPDGHSIDRIDNNKGYSPGNCRWASAYQQAHNKRNTIYIQHGSKTKSLAALAYELGISRTRLYFRVVICGWPIEEALDYGLFKRRNINDKVRSNKYQHLTDASHAVFVALRSGILTKPDICEFGNCEQPAEQAHHHLGYAPENRLNVQWLCKGCHYRIHSNIIEFGGVSKTIKEWAEDLGIDAPALRGRLRSPLWTLERALTTQNTVSEII